MPTPLETRLREPESRARELEAAFAAARVLREAEISPDSPQARELFDELVDLPDQEAMRSHIAASKAGVTPLRESAYTPAARKLLAEGSANLRQAGVPTFDGGPLRPKPLALREAAASALAERGIPIVDDSGQPDHGSAPSALEAAGIPLIADHTTAGQPVRLLESQGLERVQLRESIVGGIIRRISP